MSKDTILDFETLMAAGKELYASVEQFHEGAQTLKKQLPAYSKDAISVAAAAKINTHRMRLMNEAQRAAIIVNNAKAHLEAVAKSAKATDEDMSKNIDGSFGSIPSGKGTGPSAQATQLTAATTPVPASDYTQAPPEPAQTDGSQIEQLASVVDTGRAKFPETKSLYDLGQKIQTQALNIHDAVTAAKASILNHNSGAFVDSFTTSTQNFLSWVEDATLSVQNYINDCATLTSSFSEFASPSGVPHSPIVVDAKNELNAALASKNFEQIRQAQEKWDGLVKQTQKAWTNYNAQTDFPQRDVPQAPPITNDDTATSFHGHPQEEKHHPNEHKDPRDKQDPGNKHDPRQEKDPHDQGKQENKPGSQPGQGGGQQGQGSGKEGGGQQGQSGDGDAGQGNNNNSRDAAGNGRGNEGNDSKDKGLHTAGAHGASHAIGTGLTNPTSHGAAGSAAAALTNPNKETTNLTAASAGQGTNQGMAGQGGMGNMGAMAGKGAGGEEKIRTRQFIDNIDFYNEDDGAHEYAIEDTYVALPEDTTSPTPPHLRPK